MCKLSNSQSCSPIKNHSALNGNSPAFVAPPGLSLLSSHATPTLTGMAPGPATPAMWHNSSTAMQYFSNILPLAPPLAAAKKSDQPHTTTRLLLPAWSAGRIIGRGGEVINGIRELSGAHITILQSGTDNRSIMYRMVSVSGPIPAVGLALQLIGSQAGVFDDDLPAQQQVLAYRGGGLHHTHAHHQALLRQQHHQQLHGSAAAAGLGLAAEGGSDLGGAEDMEDPGVRMLIEGGLVGQLLGRRGHRIQEMRMQTGVRRIQVLNAEESRLEGSIRNERIVIIMGTADQCRKAHQLISLTLECDPAQLEQREQQLHGAASALDYGLDYGSSSDSSTSTSTSSNPCLPTPATRVAAVPERVLSAFLGRGKKDKQEDAGAVAEIQHDHNAAAETNNDKGEALGDKQTQGEEEDMEFVDALSSLPAAGAAATATTAAVEEKVALASLMLERGVSSSSLTGSASEDGHHHSSNSSHTSSHGSCHGHDDQAEFSSEIVVRISNDNIGKLIGKDGFVIRRIRTESHCRIEIDNCPPTREFTMREVRIRGHIQHTHVAAQMIAQQMFGGGSPTAAGDV